LGNLKVGRTALYELAQENEDELPVVVAALAKHKTKLSNADARLVIKLACLKHRHGDLPAAALLALDRLSDDPAYDSPWEAKARASLKTKRPDSEAAADKIIADSHGAHIGGLFSKFGTLPPIPMDALAALDEAYMRARKADPESVFRALSKFK
jgi:hypothetical protein